MQPAEAALTTPDAADGSKDDKSEEPGLPYDTLKNKINELVRLCATLNARIQKLERQRGAGHQDRLVLIQSISKLEVAQTRIVGTGPTPESSLIAMLRRELALLYKDNDDAAKDE